MLIPLGILAASGGGIDLQYLVIAGGGGGGCGYASNAYGGGGGAGGYRSNVAGQSSGGGASAEASLTLEIGTNYSVTVGAGGAGISYIDGALLRNGSPGSNSIFSTVTSNGGGFGAGQDGNGGSGGSGGGAGPFGGVIKQLGGAGTSAQGFAGANGTGTQNGGAGGGAGSAASTTTAGVGVASTITGSSITRAAGGGMFSGTPGTANSGGGGAGGASAGNSGAGGSGVVILRYPDTFTITIGAGLTGSTPAPAGGFKVTTITAGTGNVSWAG